MVSFRIKDREISEAAPCFLIAEFAQSHDGSLGLAHSFIDAAADAGADAVKFQTHIAEAESTKSEPFRVAFGYEDDSRYDYWKRLEWKEEQWQGLHEHANARDLIFLSSPFSVEAFALLDRIGIPAWKIGSGEINNPLLLSAVGSSGKPVLLSTGMSTWEEIEEAVAYIRTYGNPLAIFQCTSKYPTSYSEVGLNVMSELAQSFKVPVGLSDHSGSIFPGLAAMAGNASLLEVHVTFHRSMFGPDVPVSVTLDELKLLVEARDAFHLMKTKPVDKNKTALELSEMRSLFNKSVALSTDQPAGTILTKEMLTCKKPGTGIPAKRLRECIGRTLKRDVSSSVLLTWNDLQ
jgi:N-acetylneuraminate synthase